ncbi:uncharacterized protein LOC134080900 [Sardina pilchardus]|uniref:uncharacterized protein LOC134080900 n=1 Tax=Sardina pilchardus TaxID=27697 RepID=UPI002E163789
MSSYSIFDVRDRQDHLPNSKSSHRTPPLTQYPYRKSALKPTLQATYNHHDRSEEIRRDFLALEAEKGFHVYLKGIKECIQRYRHHIITLKYEWKIGDFEDTIFKDDKTHLENWQEQYLPDHMRMQVLGTIRDNSCTPGCPEIVLLLCEDRKIFAYRELEMHFLANNLEELFGEGICFPGKKIFHHDQCFEDLTEDDLEKARRSDEMVKLKEELKTAGQPVIAALKASIAAFQSRSKVAERQRQRKKTTEKNPEYAEPWVC